MMITIDNIIFYILFVIRQIKHPKRKPECLLGCLLLGKIDKFVFQIMVISDTDIKLI